MTSDFRPGDRVRAIDDAPIIDDLRGKAGVVTAVDRDDIYVRMDEGGSPSTKGWRFDAQNLVQEFPEPTEEEVAILFGLVKTDPCQHCQGTGIAT